jgi:hypothetical protein
MSTEAPPRLTREQIVGMPAGREMDALLAVRLGLPLEPPCPKMHITDDAQWDRDGWAGWCYTCGESISDVPPEAAPYSTSISTAWHLLELCHASIPAPSPRWLSLVRALPVYPLHMSAADLSLSICRAALLSTLEDS